MPVDLERLVNTFDDGPLVNGRLMREFLASDPDGFRRAAAPLLKDASAERGHRYLITLLRNDDMLIRALFDASALDLEAAINVARTAAKVDPQFHARLLRQVLDSIEGGPGTSDDQGANRLLEILGASGESGGILPMLTQLLRHPDPHIRSKAALLMGRSNKSADLLQKRMAEADPRVRANAIEAFWGAEGEKSQAILRDAASDTHNRAAGNALLGLYRTGDAASVAAFLEMIENNNPVFRLTAVWALGETEDPRFLSVLGRMLRDAQGPLRNAVFQAIRKIKAALSRTAALPRLQVAILRARATADAVHLNAMIEDPRCQFLPRLPATRFVIWHEGVLVARYSVEERGAGDSISVGFAVPQRGESADSLARICEESLISCLSCKRKNDLWCVLRYTGGALPVDVTEPVSGQPPAAINFSADSSLLRNRIQSAGAREKPTTDLVSAAERLLERTPSVHGSRHIILLQEKRNEPGSLRHIATMAREARVSVYAVSLCPDDEMHAVCIETGGAFLGLAPREAVAGVLESLYRSLMFHYELRYTPDLASSPHQPEVPVRLQVFTTEGQGEACAQVF